MASRVASIGISLYGEMKISGVTLTAGNVTKNPEDAFSRGGG